MSSRSECKHKMRRGGKHGSGAAAMGMANAPTGWLTLLAHHALIAAALAKAKTVSAEHVQAALPEVT